MSTPTSTGLSVFPFQIYRITSDDPERQASKTKLRTKDVEWRPILLRPPYKEFTPDINTSRWGKSELSIAQKHLKFLWGLISNTLICF